MGGKQLVSILVAVTAGAFAAGCGDSGKKCGANTVDMNGSCVGGDQVTCSNGTMLDPATNTCVIDPNACQDGTVLVMGKCVDPGHITPDLEEGPEPNGLGVSGEDSTSAAGDIQLKPAGTPVIIHGKIIPFQDLDSDGQQDADVDTYTLTVNAPTLIDVSADGLHGLAGAFVSFAIVTPDNALASWQRFGINLTGDTSKRQLYLPAAGDYVITVADTRTLFLTGGAAGAEANAEPFEYYVTINTLAATPTALTPNGSGLVSQTGQIMPGEVKLYTVPMGEGLNNGVLTMTVDQAIESLVVANARGSVTTVKAVGDGDTGATPAQALSLGYKTGDTTTVVVDNYYNYANQPVDFDLELATGGAGALCNAATSTCPANVSQPARAHTDGDFSDFTVFYYDVTGDNEITGMDLHINDGAGTPAAVPVAGLIVDENYALFAAFTFDPFFGDFAGEFSDYTGALRHPLAGRYYVLVFDPNSTTRTTLAASGQYGALTTTAVVEGTPLTAQSPNLYHSNPFTYDAGTTDRWQQFDGSGTNSGTLTANFYAPNVTTFGAPGFAYGRLDPLPSGCGSDCDDVTPVFSNTYAAAGNGCPNGAGCEGRILLDDPATNYLLTVRAATNISTTTFGLNFARRPHTDLGNTAVGTPTTATNQALDNTTTIERYLVETTKGNGMSLTVHPNQGTLNPRAQPLFDDESANGAIINNGTAGQDETYATIAGNGWVAVTVTNAGTGTAGQTFNITATATAPVTYMATAGTTTFSDACSGGSTVSMTDLDEGRSTATIATPGTFSFYGVPAPSVRVFSNGFLSVDPGLSCSQDPLSGFGLCFSANANMPTTAVPNGIIAPYWDDLVINTSGVCQKTVGTNRLAIQWTGTKYGTTTVAQIQVILDGNNNTIELVYGPSHALTGTGGTIGIENQVGGAATKIGFNTAGAVAASSSKLFTPM